MSLIAAAASAILAQANPDIDDFVQANLKDATFVARKVSADQRELQRINRDFAQSYRFDNSTVQYKEPMMLRLESRVEDQSILYIINGATRTVRIPKANFNTRENLARAPGKRQTPFDFGLLTPSLFRNFMVAKFIRRDRATNDLVFDFFYENQNDDSTRHRVWVDPDKKVISRREWYSQNGGHLVATFVYEEPKQYSGVWVPTRVSVRNAANKVAGVTEYASVRVNTGLADSLFAVR